MKLIIAGSRTIEDAVFVEAAFIFFVKRNNWVITEIVSGGAKGVDSIAEHIALKYNIKFKLFAADWNQYGRRAGHIRNAQMAEHGDELLLIWDGSSPGSTNMRQQMTSRNKRLSEVILRDE